MHISVALSTFSRLGSRPRRPSPDFSISRLSPVPGRRRLPVPPSLAPGAPPSTWSRPSLLWWPPVSGPPGLWPLVARASHLHVALKAHPCGSRCRDFFLVEADGPQLASSSFHGCTGRLHILAAVNDAAESRAVQTRL